MKKYSKYELYEASVQDSPSELDFFHRVYQNVFNKKATVFREDFCSTFLNSVTWVKRNKKNIAYAVDLNPEPLEYGCANHIAKLSENQKERIFLFNENVLKVRTPPADLITVSNFSICFLKQRKSMVNYFTSCFKSLKSKGVVIFDLLGGEELADPVEDKTPFKLDDGTKAFYYWEHDGFNPINHEAKFHIHYKIKGKKKQMRVFSYDWRMWSLPELQDILKEAGFSSVDVYWEGDAPRGNGGNGVFRKASKAESCPIWIAYIVGIKK